MLGNLKASASHFDLKVINGLDAVRDLGTLDACLPTDDPASFLSRCVSVDLEVDPKTTRLFAFAAVRGEASFLHRTGPWAALDAGLDRLEAFCDGAAHLVGHNILRHDLPHLEANRAWLAGLGGGRD